MTNKFYVYAHYKPNDTIPFYIGKGSGNRAYDKIGRKYNPFWIRTVEKAGGFIVKKLLENLSNKDALCMEALYINAYGRRDQNKGPLVNLTNGGEGCSGYKRTSEMNARHSKLLKEKYASGEFVAWNKGIKVPIVSAKMKGNKNGCGPKPPRTKEHCEHLSESHIGQTPWNIGISSSLKTREKQREAALKREPPTKETLEKRSKSMKGKNNWAAGSKSIYNIETNQKKKIKQGECLPEGWAFGRGK